ncbi:MAG: hypothetical protein IJH36_06645, partial [Clostridia bacterium]|nr:hypothetical protein [Clostridia bacterium]
KVKPAGTGTSWWLYAAPNNNAQAGGSETYLGVLEQNTKLTLERYKSGRSDCANKDGVLTLNEWHDVLISIADNVTSIYVDGVQAGSAASNVDISDMLGSKSVAYIGKANWGNGEYATGYIDDFVIYNYAFDTALASLDLGDTSAVTDDLTLPAKVGDTNITWATSDAEVVTNTGVVTRADETKTATLTASAVVNGITLTKTFDITVTGKTAVLDTFAAYAENGSIKFTSDWTNEEEYDLAVAIASVDVTPEYVNQASNTASGEFKSLENGTYRVSATMHERTVTRTVTVKDEEEMGAYLFAHFVGNESTADMEQIYFSVSQDGSAWQLLNGGKPVIKSTVGTTGVRDPYIMRTEDNKFVIIATDLSIFELNKTQGSNKWGYSVTKGSKNVVVWKSDTIDGWSDSTPQQRKVAVDEAGCAWAPEAIYDPDEGKYMVFWASMVNGKHSIYRSYTTDFENFTEPELYIDNPTSTIDTTIIADKGVYYRFTKDETYKAINMMKCTSLSGEWKEVDSYTLNGKAGTSYTGYEGPTIYKLNNENKWCLLLDLYSSGKGYSPFVTEALSSGAFTSPNAFTFPNGVTYRHGTVMPITTAEYNALLAAYPNNN